MKKLFLIPLLVLVVASIVLSGCSGSTTTEPAATSAPAATTSAPAATTPAVEPIVLKFSSPELEDSYDVVKLIEPWLDSIEAASGGQIEIERHWAETLVALPDSYQAVLDGVVDIAHFFPSMVAGQFTMDEYEYLPPMDYLSYRPSRLYWELYETFPEMEAQYSEVKLIAHTSEIGAFLCTPAKLLTTIEDFDGLTIDSAGQTPALRMEAFGMVPVPLAPTEVYTSLEKGLIEAHMLPLKNLFAYNWGELMQYLYMFRFTSHNQGFIMNLDQFNALPGDLQAIMVDLGGMNMADLSDEVRWEIHNEAYDRAINELGLEVIDISDALMADLQAANETAVAQYIAGLEDKGQPGQELFDEYLRLDQLYADSQYAFD